LYFVSKLPSTFPDSLFDEPDVINSTPFLDFVLTSSLTAPNPRTK